jgi:ribosomal protein S18 acetylase RimI-like enzyme
MSTPITIKTVTYQDASPIAHIQIAGWRASYQGIIPESHLNNLSVSDKTSFWQSILIDPVKAKEILVAQRDDNSCSSNDQSKTAPQIMGFVSFGSADGSPAGRDAETTTEASRRGELRAIYVDPRHLSEGVGRDLWMAAQEKMVKLGYSTVVVSVFAGNERAIRFYHKAGFTESQTGQTTVGGATVGTIQLSKTL